MGSRPEWRSQRGEYRVIESLARGVDAVQAALVGMRVHAVRQQDREPGLGAGRQSEGRISPAAGG